MNKKEIRAAFRNAVFTRDKYTCLGCGFKSSPDKALEDLDAHHIISRDDFAHGGYVKSNGATLCKHGENCHLKAEQGQIAAEDLYLKIGSSKAQAILDDLQWHEKQH